MSFTEILIIALALAADAFAVALSVGVRHRSPRQIFRLSFHSGLFQALFPLVGALLGSGAGAFLKPWDHILAAGLLAGIGVKMIVGYFSKSDDAQKKDPTRGLTMVLLSAAVSVDAFAVGCSLGLEEVSIPLAVTTIGVVTTLCAAVGMLLAGRIGEKVGKRAELVAGLVLILIAAKNTLHSVFSVM